MPKISVVVPVYNVEPYLDRCLNSLVYQTISDIEIVVVNDGSTDKSRDIISRYVASYPNKLFAYDKPNGGLSDARNYGITKCHGDYIGFVDSDDYVDLDMFKLMYDKAISKNFDVVVCDVRLDFGNRSIEISSNVDEDKFDKDSIKKQMLDIYPTAWNKIYKKNLLGKINFKKDVWYEDVEFLYRLFPYINSIGTLKMPLINYVQRSGAISKTYNKKIFDYINNFNGIVEFYKKNNFYEEYYSELEYCYVKYLYTTFIKAASHLEKVKYKKACIKAKENVLEHFPDYKKNKYIKKGIENFYLRHFNNFTSSLVYCAFHLRKDKTV